jgi:hypothetical protein
MRISHGRFVEAALLTCLFASSPGVADPQPPEFTEFARVDWHQVAAPFGRVLLIRGAKGQCAVRFAEYQRGHDAKPPTVFSSGEESHYASYEWSYQVDGTGDFTNRHATHGTGRVSRGAVRGIGRFGFQSGDPYLRCGPLKTFWLQPSNVSFSEQVLCQTPGYQLSPTGWRDISKVNANDVRLQWFECDEKRNSYRIPLRDLPGGR